MPTQTSTADLPSRAKRVILSFGAGGLAEGLSVTLQIGWEGKAPSSEAIASLQADAELEQCFQTWSRCYGSLAANDRPFGIAPAEKSPSGRHPATANLAACERAGRILGDRFNQWLRQPNLLPLREAWLEKLRPEDELRVILQTQDRDLQRLPWHQWDLLERYPKAEIALGCLGYNQPDPVAAPASGRRLPSPAPVKILAILGDSSGIDVQGDRALLEQLPGAAVTFLIEPQRSELNDQLWQQPWRILFFAGHSSSDAGQGRFRINGQETLSLEQLKLGLRRAVEQGLELAIFNSCDGLGLAQELAQLEIPLLIVMREPVPDRVAQTFLKYFLSAYGIEGTAFYPAVRQARERLQALEGEFPCATWLPIIVQNPAAVPKSWRSLCNPSTTIQPTANHPAAIQTSTQPWSTGLKKVVAASLLSSAAILGIRHLGWLQPFELKAYDHLLQLRPQEPPDSRLLIIEVTEEDLQAQRDQGHQGSLSDSALSQLLTLLNQHEPIAIGLDIYRDYPAGSPELAQQLKASTQLVAVCRASQAEESGVAPPPEVSVERQGFSDGVVDPDQVLRRHLLAASPPADSPCGARYAFSTQLALRYLAAQEIDLEQLDNGAWQLGQARFQPMTQLQGSYQAADLWGYQTLLNYRSHKSIEGLAPRISLGAALAGDLQAELIRDRIILIGTTAQSFRDDSATPYSSESPGVILQAQMVSQLLSAALDGRSLLWIPPWWWDWLWVGVWSALGGGLAWFCQGHRLKFLFIGLGAGLALHYLSCLTVLVHAGGWLPLVPGSLGLLLATGLWLLVPARASLRNRRRRPGIEDSEVRTG
jgi:CHASE2 domain-containing sensor protein